MESCPFPRTPPCTTSPTSSKKPFLHTQTILHKNIHFSVFLQTHIFRIAAVKSPKGFGPPLKKKKNTKKVIKSPNNIEDQEKADEGDDVIPEIVTKRMLNRVGASVGIPLFIGLVFFPFFYYLKVGLKVDVPTWIPFIVSFIFFGSALAGISYGIVSTSWDPMREGSLLGWVEAQRNWPVFWESLLGKRSGKN